MRGKSTRVVEGERRSYRPALFEQLGRGPGYTFTKTALYLQGIAVDG